MNNYEKTKLPNGITILSESIPYVKSFSLGFWFNVGSRDESKKNNGITHFIEHMLFKGTTHRSAKKIAEDIEAYGGYLNAFTSKEHTCYYGRGLREHLSKTFDVISDMIQYPTFKVNDIKKESTVIIDEMNDINDNPEELIFDRFEELLFDGNTLSMPIIGTEANVRSFTQDDLFDFVDQKYGFNNLIIAGTGAVEHSELIRLTEKYFKRDLGKKKLKRKDVVKTTTLSSTLTKPIQQVHIIIGKSTYGYKTKQRTAVNILSHILGEGSSSRLFQAIREKKGISYQLNSFLNSFLDVSTFGVYLSTNKMQASLAEELIFKEFRKMREKAVSSKELNKAKEYIKGNVILSLESMTSRMFRMSSSQIYFDRLITIDELVSLIDEVSADDILELSNEVLAEGSLSKIILSPEN